MRTRARETASQVGPRNCSKEIRGEVSIYVVLVWRGRGGDMCSQVHILAEGCCPSPGACVAVNDFSAFLDMRRCKNLGL